MSPTERDIEPRRTLDDAQATLASTLEAPTATDQAYTVTVKSKLDELQARPRPRFEYKMANAADGEWERADADDIIRQALRDTRWHAFLFHGGYYWVDIAAQYFLPPGQSKDDLPDDNDVLRVKQKILDSTKNIKSDTLKRFDTHVKQVLTDHPELLTVSLRESDLVKDFFIDKIWSQSTFEFIWFWIKGYVNIMKSSELGRYYNQRKSPLSQLPGPPSQAYRYIEIYGTLCYMTLLVQRARIDEPDKVDFHIKRRHLVYFECVTLPSFDDISKSEFHEILHGTRGERGLQKRPVTVGSLAAAMMGTMPPPPPRRS